MDILYRVLIFSAVSLNALGCTDDDPLAESICTLGDSERCDLEDGEPGRRWCSPEGRFGACTGQDDEDFPRSPGSARDPSTATAGPAAPDAGRSGGAAVLGTCSSHVMPVRVLDAEYSASLDRIVAVGATPNVLSVYDPRTHEARNVALPALPKAVSVAPDGRTAAVAHDAYVSIVDLQAAALQATIPTTCDAADVVLGGNGYAYVFPVSDNGDPVHSVEIATRTDRSSSTARSFRRGTHGRLHPGGATLYSLSAQSSWDMARFDVRTTPVASASTSTFSSSTSSDQALACTGLWFTETGDRMFTACGGVFRSPDSATARLEYAGKLGTAAQSYGSSYRWVVHSAAAKRIYAVPFGEGTFPSSSRTSTSLAETQVRAFGDDFLQLERSLDVPCLDTKAGKQRVYGRFAFVDPSGKQLYVLGQLAPEAGAAMDWTSAVIDL